MHKLVALYGYAPLRISLGILDNARHHLCGATPFGLQKEQAVAADLCGIALSPLKIILALDDNL